jgi:ribosomal protein S12 methylthiotransferase accessory factor YcaO
MRVTDVFDPLIVCQGYFNATFDKISKETAHTELLLCKLRGEIPVICVSDPELEQDIKNDL